MTERRHYRISGQVQGVGFRYRAQYAAQTLRLTGWVANQYDGTVEMEAQGEPAALDKLLPLITHSSQWIEIADVQTERIPVDLEERRFRVTGC